MTYRIFFSPVTSCDSEFDAKFCKMCIEVKTSTDRLFHFSISWVSYFHPQERLTEMFDEAMIIKPASIQESRCCYELPYTILDCKFCYGHCDLPIKTCALLLDNLSQHSLGVCLPRNGDTPPLPSRTHIPVIATAAAYMSYQDAVSLNALVRSTVATSFFRSVRSTSVSHQLLCW